MADGRGLDWFRMYHDIIDDDKLTVYTADEKWVWVTMLCMASRSPVRGHLLIGQNKPATAKHIAGKAGVPTAAVEQIIPRFEDDDMVCVEDGCWVVTHWTERQYDNPSDTPGKVRERKARMQERRQQNSGTSAERPRNEGGTSAERVGNDHGTSQNDLDSESETDTERDMGGGRGEPSGDPSADAEGAPSDSPAALAAPPPVASGRSQGASVPVDPLVDALDHLRALPGYVPHTDDLQWLASKAGLFPGVDLSVEIAGCADWWAPRDDRSGPKPRHWRNRLHNRFAQAKEIADRDAALPPARASPPSEYRRLDTDENLRAFGLGRAEEAGAG